MSEAKSSIVVSKERWKRQEDELPDVKGVGGYRKSSCHRVREVLNGRAPGVILKTARDRITRWAAGKVFGSEGQYTYGNPGNP